jgi:hypothetical protein
MAFKNEGFQWNEDQLGDLIRAIALFSVPRGRSNTISAVGYDQDAQILALQFRKDDEDGLPLIYGYINVPPQELEALLTAASMGQYANKTIKPRYECVRVLPEPEPLATA